MTELAAKHTPGTWHSLPKATRDDIVHKNRNNYFPRAPSTFSGETRRHLVNSFEYQLLSMFCRFVVSLALLPTFLFNGVPGVFCEQVSKIVTELAAKHMPGTWHFLPEATRDDIVLKALEDVPIFMRAFMTEVKTDIDEVLDVHHMVVTNLVQNKSLMNRVRRSHVVVVAATAALV